MSYRFFVGYVLSSLLLILFSPVLNAKCMLMVPAGSGSNFWAEMERGVEVAALNLGYEIYIRGPDDEANTNAQDSVLHDFIYQLGCKALLLAPNAQRRKYDVERLNSRGIATIFVDRDIGGADVVAVVASDNAMIGVRAADEMAKILGPSDKIAMLKLAPKVASTQKREDAFRHRAGQLGLNIALEEYLGTSVSEVKLSVTHLKDKMVDIDAIFTPNEVTTVGVQSAIPLITDKNFYHIGVDSSDIVESFIAQERIVGVVVQDPYIMGVRSVELMDKHLNGELVESNYWVPVRFIDKNHLDSR